MNFINKYLTLIGVLVSSTMFAQVSNAPDPSVPPLPPVSNFPGLQDYPYFPAFNYTRVYTPEVRENNTANLNLQSSKLMTHVETYYSDGLNRPLQEVYRLANGYSDIVRSHVYDAAGRESYQYLPYSHTHLSVDGKIDMTPLASLPFFYNGQYPGDAPYGKIETDNSPLNRTQKILAPGHSWVGSNRGKIIERKTNLSNQANDRIYKFNIGYNAADIPVFTGILYTTNELYVTVETDEDGKKMGVYTDNEGKIIAIRTYSEDFTGLPQAQWQNVYHITYYVYDEMNRLRYIITPEGYKQMIANTATMSNNIASGLCYKYFYDKKGRVIERRLPGKAAEYFIYDLRDRLVLSQDGNLRGSETDDWHFTIYDSRNRPCVTGIYHNSTLSNGDMRNYWTGIANTLATISAGTLEHFIATYTQVAPAPQSLPQCDMLTYNYYDDYSAPALAGNFFTNAHVANLTGSSTYCDPYPTSRSIHTHGLLTGTRVKNMVLNPNRPWLISRNYYNDRGEVIQTRSENHLGGHEYMYYQYDFTGALVSTVNAHSVPFGGPMGGTRTEQISKSYEKNPVTGLPLRTQEQINGVGWTPIANYSFDNLRRLINKNLGNASIRNAYRYNIRGWLTAINPTHFTTAPNPYSGPFFGELLSYDKGFSNKHYNGTISGVIWKNAGANAQRHYYGYKYDNLNRLTEADFARYQQDPVTQSWSWKKTNLDYSASNITYDYNGNIKTMNQRGTEGNNPPFNMDVLNYEYYPNTNKLKHVTDNGINSSSLPDFKGGSAAGGTSYVYDANGNMIQDAQRSITSVNPIDYSYLNKPTEVAVNGKGTVTYGYDALGNKLQKKVYDITSATTTTWDYVGPFVYKNNVLETIYHEEGRVRVAPPSNQIPIEEPYNPNPVRISPYTYDYFVKDHLENVRSVVTTEIVPVNEYMATHEVSMANIEGAIFSNIDNVRDNNPSSTNPNDLMAAQLDGNNPNKQIGTAIMLRVMAGDQFDLNVNTYYENEMTSPDVPVETSIINSLFNSLMGGTTYAGTPINELPANMQIVQNALSNPALAGEYASLISANTDPMTPAAHLSYLMFDEQFNLVPANSGVLQFGSAANQWDVIGTDGLVDVAQNGYLVAFIGSSSSSRLVWGDKFRVKFHRGRLIEEDHYYPFGLTLYTQPPTPAEKNYVKYNTMELQRDEFTLNNGNKTGPEWYDYGARTMDPQIGRWMQIEPLASQYVNHSPYAYTMNNPVLFNDPDGRDAKVTVVGNKITIDAIVNVKGVDKLDRINELNDFVNNPRYSKMFNGKSRGYCVKINFKFQLATGQSADSEIPPHGENIMNYKDWGNNRRSDANIRVNPGKSRYQAANYIRMNTNSGMNSGYNGHASLNTGIHEVFHLLGLKDRYSQSTYIAFPGFLNDVMGQMVYNVEQIHWDNLTNYILQQGGNFTLNEVVDRLGAETSDDHPDLSGKSYDYSGCDCSGKTGATTGGTGSGISIPSGTNVSDGSFGGSSGSSGSTGGSTTYGPADWGGKK